MGRTSKKAENSNIDEQTAEVIQEEATGLDSNTPETAPETAPKDVSEDAPENVSEDAKEKGEIPPRVTELMRLYPHYEEFWVTSRGFVHPVGTPQYLLKDATLYKNKFYKK